MLLNSNVTPGTEVFLTKMYNSLAKSMHSYFLSLFMNYVLLFTVIPITLVQGFALNLRLKHSSQWGILRGCG